MISGFLILLLTSATVLSFKVKELQNNVNKFHTLTAQAAETTFTFAAVGDIGASSGATATLNEIAVSSADFTLALGDLSYNQITPEASWCDYVKSQVGSTFPFQLLSGNHEDNGPDGNINNFAACLPDRIGGLIGSYAKEYYFDYLSLVRFILISPDLTIDGQEYNYSAGSSRYDWVSSAIDGARSSGIPWVVVANHKNCITIATKSCEIGADLMNMLMDKKVDLVLQSHDHTYQRSKQLSCAMVNNYKSSCVVDDGADDIYSADGTIFLIVGSGGKTLYNINTSDAEIGYFAKWMGANINPRKGFAQITVSASQIITQFVGSTSGSFSDTFTIKKLTTHSDGTLISPRNDPKVYLLENGQRRFIPNPDIFSSHQFTFSQVKEANAGDLSMPSGSDINYREGTLLKASAKTVYLVDFVSGAPKKRAFTSASVFRGLGYDWDEVMRISDSRLPAVDGVSISSTSSHPDGTLVKVSSDPKVYLLENSQRRFIPSPADFYSYYHFKWSKVKLATSIDIAKSVGSNLQFREGTLIKGSSTYVYSVDYVGGAIQKKVFTSASIFRRLYYDWGEIFRVSDSQLPMTNGSDII